MINQSINNEGAAAVCTSNIGDGEGSCARQHLPEQLPKSSATLRQQLWVHWAARVAHWAVLTHDIMTGDYDDACTTAGAPYNCPPSRDLRHARFIR